MKVYDLSFAGSTLLGTIILTTVVTGCVGSSSVNQSPAPAQVRYIRFFDNQCKNGFETKVYGISNRGEVVGSSSYYKPSSWPTGCKQQAFIDNGSTASWLGFIPGFTLVSEAYTVSDSGVAGGSSDNGSVYTGMLASKDGNKQLIGVSYSAGPIRGISPEETYVTGISTDNKMFLYDLTQSKFIDLDSFYSKYDIASGFGLGVANNGVFVGGFHSYQESYGNQGFLCDAQANCRVFNVSTDGSMMRAISSNAQFIVGNTLDSVVMKS